MAHCFRLLSMALALGAGMASGPPAVFDIGHFDAATEPVARETNGFETPVNQLASAGTLVELPGVRSNALALSPDG